MPPPSPPSRRFPPPWSVIEVAEAYCVVDASGFRYRNLFCMIERGANSDRMTKDEARRIANGIGAGLTQQKHMRER